MMDDSKIKPVSLQSSEKEASSSIPETADEQRAETDTYLPASNESGMKQAFVEVFVGGLPPDATDEGVERAFATVGEVLSLRLNRRKKTGECKGFGFIRYADQEIAERACQGVKEACGKPVGVHISRARSLEQAADEQQPVPADEYDFDTALNKLVRLLRGHSDKRAAIVAATKAVVATPSKQKSAAPDKALEDSNRGEALDGRIDEEDARMKEDDLLPDPATFLESYPRCKRLLDTFRANPNTHNKTPLAVLHEYATRLSLELMYDESADSNLGPFTVDARLTSVGGSVLYATGEGRGRGKKDAKQVAAAAVLEMLLANVPEQDFLQPGKGKFLRLRVNPRATSASSGRSNLLARGRGRGRWGGAGRLGRGMEYPGQVPSYSQLSSNAGYDLQTYATPSSNHAPQDIDMYRLPAAPTAAGKVRSFLAGHQDVDLLRSLRGHSLDTLQRQLAALPVGQEAPLGMYGNSRSFDNSAFTFGNAQEQEQAQAALRSRAGYSNMASMPEGTLQMLGVGPGGLVTSPSQASPSTNFQAPMQHFPPY